MGGAGEDQTQHLGVDVGVVPDGAGRGDAGVEGGDGGDRAGAIALEDEPAELRIVGGVAVVLLEGDAGGHVQQRADWGLPELGVGEFGDIGLSEIVDGVDRSVLQRDADQQRGDGLGHRLRCHPIVLGSCVLIVLEQDGVVFGDQ